MSLLRKLGIGVATFGLAALIIGCQKNDGDVVSKAANNHEIKLDERYGFGATPALAEFGDKTETIITQIIDVQDGFVQYSSEGGQRIFKYVKVKGGDVDEIVLIYPQPLYFDKFKPAKITFTRINNHQISAKEFYKRYVGVSQQFRDYDNYMINADGIIEPNGVEYIKEEGK